MRNQDWEDRFEQGYDRIYKTRFFMDCIGAKRELRMGRAWGTGKGGLRIAGVRFGWVYKRFSLRRPGEFGVWALVSYLR